jgi:uncharacterized repeat protein (TIGR03803 family)
MFSVRNCLVYGLGAGAFASAALLHVPAAEAASETVLYSFCRQASCAHGNHPYAGLIDVGGTLYGTTYSGGADSSGTVFGVNPKTGVETAVYSFCRQASCADGSHPYGGLINVGGALYGTTAYGGTGTCSNNLACGTVFRVDPKTGAEMVVYSFCSQASCADGEYPTAGLINVGGTLYGTTSAGGANGYGSVFGVNPKIGVETVVYSFRSGWDGADPVGGLIDVAGTLYGTTSAGGANSAGTVFKFNPRTGAETVLHWFCGWPDNHCTDGAYPNAGLIDVSGTLYGTTSEGGGNGLNSGTVFSINPGTGVMNEKYAFGSGTDGAYPSGLIDVSGILFGTTSAGGANGYGTVFEVNTTGSAETVVYSFCSQANCADGENPYAGVIYVSGTLYGTTNRGGANGTGTVFKVTLP